VNIFCRKTGSAGISRLKLFEDRREPQTGKKLSPILCPSTVTIMPKLMEISSTDSWRKYLSLNFLMEYNLYFLY
jgi:hypothetical protein